MDQAEIYETIAEDNPSAAERVYQQIEERVALLARNPRLGVRKPEYAVGLRMLTRGVYLILYRTRPDNDDGTVDEVEIVTIVHGNRNIDGMFSSD